MTPDFLRLTQDARLSPEAFRVVMAVATKGTGEHEIPKHEFTMLLNNAGERKVARAIALACALGWIRRSSGGRGHSDRFEFTPSLSVTVSDSPSNSRALSDRVPNSDDVKEPLEHANRPIYVDRSANSDDVSAPVVVVGEVVGDDEEGASARELDFTAADLIAEHEDHLGDCAALFRRYLAMRVPRNRQFGYASTVVDWVVGDTDPSAFRTPTGEQLAAGLRPQVLRTAFNELLATDEGLMSRPVGDPGNLKTKLSVLLKQRHGPPPQRQNGVQAPPALPSAREQVARAAVADRKADADLREERAALEAYSESLDSATRDDLEAEVARRIREETPFGRPEHAPDGIIRVYRVAVYDEHRKRATV